MTDNLELRGTVCPICGYEFKFGTPDEIEFHRVICVPSDDWKEALDYFNKRIKLGQCGNSTTQRKAFEAAIEALQKVEAYERFIEYFVFEGGYGDYSAMCEYMTWHNDTWCSEHCGADAPYLECAIRWSEERGE